MLTYALEKNGSSSLYTQLYGCIRRDILSGALPPRQKLPSKRALAQHLEVSVITVKNAYEQLAAEGYIYTVEKKGYYVSPVERPLPPADPPPLTPEKPAEPVFLDLATGSLDRSYFPFTVWSRLMRQTILEEDTELLRPPPPTGPRPCAGHRRPPAPVPGHGRGPGADHHRRGNGAAIHPDHPAAGPGEALCRGGPGLWQDRQNLPGPPGSPVPGGAGQRRPGRGPAAPPAGGRGPHLPFSPLPHRHRHAHHPAAGAAALGGGGAGAVYLRGRLRQRVPLCGPSHPHPVLRQREPAGSSI